LIKGENKMTKMKKLIECEDEGLGSLLGERVTFFCLNYIYTGKLIGVNDEEALLDDAYVVFETGPLDSKDWKDTQPLPNKKHTIRMSAVESYGIVK